MPIYIQPPYPAYYSTYYQYLPDGNVLDILKNQLQHELAQLAAIPDEKRTYAYAEGKWTVAQLIGHVVDAERIFAYRILCIARGEQNSLPGFEEDDYVRHAHFNDFSIAELTDELRLVREANLALFRTLRGDDMERVGSANGNPVSLHALLAVTAGHLAHHMSVLKERYQVL